MSVGNSKGTSEKKIQKTFSKLPSRNPPRGPAKILQKFLLKLSRSSFWEYPGISKKSLNKNSGFLGGGEVQFKFLYEFLQELLKLFQKQSPEKKNETTHRRHFMEFAEEISKRRFWKNPSKYSRRTLKRIIVENPSWNLWRNRLKGFQKKFLEES